MNMVQRATWVVMGAAIWGASVMLAAWSGTDAGQARQGRGGSGWTLPSGASEEKNPLAVNDAVIANGRKLFLSKCQRCHGPQGKGDGPDADKTHLHHMDLTSPANAKNNPDGVVFHKIWNGRSNPKMPTFSEELSKEQVWAIVAYVQTLRAK